MDLAETEDTVGVVDVGIEFWVKMDGFAELGDVDVEINDEADVGFDGCVDKDGSVEVVGVKLSRGAGLDSMLGCCEGWVDTEVFVVMVACRRAFV